MNTLTDVEILGNKLLNSNFNIKDIFGNTTVLNAKQMGYIFKFDNAKRRFGCCKYVKKQITLSKHMCEINLNQVNGKIKDTILHELAHAFCLKIYGTRDGRGHDNKWVSIAKQIGSDGKRCFTYDDFGGLKQPKSKYTLTCPTCDKKTQMHRKPKRSYACGTCCANGYDSKHKLAIKQNH
jgi:predicted SprT family Zn-dependent metalloprotease